MSAPTHAGMDVSTQRAAPGLGCSTTCGYTDPINTVINPILKLSLYVAIQNNHVYPNCCSRACSSVGVQQSGGTWARMPLLSRVCRWAVEYGHVENIKEEIESTILSDMLTIVRWLEVIYRICRVV